MNREIVAWDRLDHINIAKFLGVVFGLKTPMGFKVGHRGGHSIGLVSPFIPCSLLDFVVNQPTHRLRVVCRRLRTYVNVSDLVFQAQEIARGLRYLHGMNIVHADLKHVSERPNEICPPLLQVSTSS